MRILLDQGTPAPLCHALAQHDVQTAYERGWSTLANGDLLLAAEAEFDVFVEIVAAIDGIQPGDYVELSLT